jgi:hypothetical protein
VTARISTKFGVAAVACLFAITVTKELRAMLWSAGASSFESAPSFFAAAVVVFGVQAAWPGARKSNITRVAAVSAGLTIGWEFAQAIPPLNAVRTFDWIDVLASGAGVALAAAASYLLWRTDRSELPERQIRGTA